MRGRTVAIVCLLLPLTGCTGDPQGTQAPAAPELLGYHARALDAEQRAWTVFAVQPDGAAFRVNYTDDRSAAVGALPGVEFSKAKLAALFDAQRGNLNRSAGGTVTRVEEGVLPAGTFATLRDALAGNWTPTVGTPEDTRGDDYVRIRAAGGADVVRAVDDPAFARLADAFATAEADFVPFRVHAPAPTGPLPTSPSPCMRADAIPSRGAMGPNESLAIRVRVTSCELRDVALGTPGCVGLVVSAAVFVDGRRYELDAAGAAVANATSCHALGTLPAESTIELRRSWNGSVRDCPTCAPRPLPPGTYSIVAFATGQAESPDVRVAILDPSTPPAPLLVVRERDWLNATGNAPAIEGYYGGHCAPAVYERDPLRLTVYAWGNSTPRPPTDGALVRDFRDGPWPNLTYSVSADRLDYAAMDGRGPLDLFSPFGPVATTRALANVTRENGTFLVDGAPLAVNATRPLHVEYEFEDKGYTYHAAHELVFESLGDAALLIEPRGFCA